MQREDYAIEIPLPNDKISKDKFMVRVGVPADGNCYFHSLLRASNNDDKLTVREFRTILADNIDKYYHDSENLKQVMTLEEVKRELSRSGAWVDERYTDYIGRSLGLKIVILTLDEKGNTIQVPGTRICGNPIADVVIGLFFLPAYSHYEYVCLVHNEKIYSHFLLNDCIFSNMVQ